MGSDRCRVAANAMAVIFQSTLPVWGATHICSPAVFNNCISIHAPRVGSDQLRRTKTFWCLYFNPRSPCGERLKTFMIPRLPISDFNPRSPCGERLSDHQQSNKPNRFQSTLPVWGATLISTAPSDRHYNFNPRSPCGERLKTTLKVFTIFISIHAPRVGSDH